MLLPENGTGGMSGPGLNGCGLHLRDYRPYKLMPMFLGKSSSALNQNTGMKLLEIFFVLGIGKR